MSSRSLYLTANFREDHAMSFFLQVSRDPLCGGGPPPPTAPADDDHGLRAHHPSKDVGELSADAQAHRCGDAGLGDQIAVLFGDQGVLSRTSGRCPIRNHPRDHHHDTSRIAMRREVPGLCERGAGPLLACRDHLQLQRLHQPTIGIAA